ncbi:Retrovirus-related Pol polyprotein from transposon TNT 1-94 [Vitis vinifera]|uniref:Retrovirus-related Pol polyprotein from transposon TNT 1-94 n=1 Tax=Vitis vinifera TaxID=29760 RepID=A0A438J370_VITVI|nr:Retrovirus-related Pol polyprotein from transposon TNT 1-94 [Vitis vinifera]
MHEEIKSLHKNNNYKLMELPKGFVAIMSLEIEQLDVKIAFLHGDLEEEIYMEQPEGFTIKCPTLSVSTEEELIWSQAGTETVKFSDEEFIILLLYVDDMMIAGGDIGKINKLKKELSKSFEMKNLGFTSQILGIKISRDRTNEKLWLSQESYIEKVLDKFNMGNTKPMSSSLGSHLKLSSKQSPSSEKEKEEMRKVSYASAMGSLMYVMVCTRPDIAHAVGVVSKFLSNLDKEHWVAVKWILKYLRGTSKTCLCFGIDKPMLLGCTDVDMLDMLIPESLLLVI